jgi:hypothetical protein
MATFGIGGFTLLELSKWRYCFIYKLVSDTANGYGDSFNINYKRKSFMDTGL